MKLLDVTLQWKNPTLEVELKLPADLPDSGQVEAEVRVKVIDQLDQAGFYDDIDVVLEVLGGIAVQPTGTTDGQGYFRTMIQLPSPAVSGDAAAAAQGPLTVTASATSFELCRRHLSTHVYRAAFRDGTPLHRKRIRSGRVPE